MFDAVCYGILNNGLIHLPAGRAQPWSAVIPDGLLQYQYPVLPSVTLTVVRGSPEAARSRRFSMQYAHEILWQTFPLCQRLACSNQQKSPLPWPPSTALNKPSRNMISQPVSIPSWTFRD